VTSEICRYLVYNIIPSKNWSAFRECPTLDCAKYRNWKFVCQFFSAEKFAVKW